MREKKMAPRIPTEVWKGGKKSFAKNKTSSNSLYKKKFEK